MIENSLVNSFFLFLKNQKGKSILTVKSYNIDLNEFSNFLEKEYNIYNFKEVNFSIIRSYVVFLVEKKHLSNRSINRKISSLRSFFKYLQQKNIIETNPALKQPFLKELQKKSIPLSNKEIIDLLDNIPFKNDFNGLRDKFMIELFYSTGIRRAELINLQLKDFDISIKQIKVLGKGNKERFIPINNNLIKIFLDYYSKLKELNIISLFLLVKSNGIELSESFVYSRIRRYMSIITQKNKKSPHILRHSFATHMLEEGADINSIKELLGHSSLSSTQVYVNNSLKKLKEDFLKSHPRGTKK